MVKKPIAKVEDEVVEEDADDIVVEDAEEVETEEDEVETVKEPVEPMTFDDIAERFTGIVNNARNAGVRATAVRFFAGIEGFLGGVSGDDKKPKE